MSFPGTLLSQGPHRTTHCGPLVGFPPCPGSLLTPSTPKSRKPLPNPGLLLCFQGSPNLMPGFIIRRGEFGHTHTHTQGRRPRESRGGDWRDAAQSQGTPRSDPAEAGRGRRNPPLEPSEGARSCWHFDLGTLASTTVRRQISVVLSSSVFGLSLWLPRDTPTASYIISLPQFLQLKKEIKMPISEGGCT